MSSATDKSLRSDDRLLQTRPQLERFRLRRSIRVSAEWSFLGRASVIVAVISQVAGNMSSGDKVLMLPGNDNTAVIHYLHWLRVLQGI